LLVLQHLGLLEWEPVQFALLQLVIDEVFQGRELCFTTLFVVHSLERVDEEDVVPDEMFFGDMLVKVLTGFFEVFSRQLADEAQVLGLVKSSVPVVSEVCEGIDNDTENDVHEDNVQNDPVHHIKCPSRVIPLSLRVRLRHCIISHSRALSNTIVHR